MIFQEEALLRTGGPRSYQELTTQHSEGVFSAAQGIKIFSRPFRSHVDLGKYSLFVLLKRATVIATARAPCAETYLKLATRLCRAADSQFCIAHQ
jgi:hypothetical protein